MATTLVIAVILVDQLVLLIWVTHVLISFATVNCVNSRLIIIWQVNWFVAVRLLRTRQLSTLVAT